MRVALEKMKTLIISEDREFKGSIIQSLNGAALVAEKITVNSLSEAEEVLAREPSSLGTLETIHILV